MLNKCTNDFHIIFFFSLLLMTTHNNTTGLASEAPAVQTHTKDEKSSTSFKTAEQSTNDKAVFKYLSVVNVLTAGPQEKTALQNAVQNTVRQEYGNGVFATDVFEYCCDFKGCGRTFDTYKGLQVMTCSRCKCLFDICDTCLPNAEPLDEALLHLAHRKADESSKVSKSSELSNESKTDNQNIECFTNCSAEEIEEESEQDRKLYMWSRDVKDGVPQMFLTFDPEYKPNGDGWALLEQISS